MALTISGFTDLFYLYFYTKNSIPGSIFRSAMKMVHSANQPSINHSLFETDESKKKKEKKVVQFISEEVSALRNRVVMKEAYGMCSKCGKEPRLSSAL